MNPARSREPKLEKPRPAQSEPAAYAMKRLAEAGEQLKRQRRAVIEAFFVSDGPVTAPELWSRVRSGGAGVSLSAVQLTLRKLVQYGLATSHRERRQLARFQPSAGTTGAYRLVCVACRAVVPFASAPIHEAFEGAAKRHGFVLRSNWVELYGTCERCAGSNRTSPDAHADR